MALLSCIMWKLSRRARNALAVKTAATVYAVSSMNPQLKLSLPY